MNKFTSVCLPGNVQFLYANTLLSLLPDSMWSLAVLRCPFLPFSHDNCDFNMRAAPFFSRQLVCFFCVYVAFVCIWGCACVCCVRVGGIYLTWLNLQQTVAAHCRFIFAHAFICACVCLLLFLWLYYMQHTHMVHTVTFPFKSIDTMLNGYKFVVASCIHVSFSALLLYSMQLFFIYILYLLLCFQYLNAAYVESISVWKV